MRHKRTCSVYRQVYGFRPDGRFGPWRCFRSFVEEYRSKRGKDWRVHGNTEKYTPMDVDLCRERMNNLFKKK